MGSGERVRPIDVAVPGGIARLHRHDPPPAAPATGLTLALGHGAGGGVAAADLVALAGALPPMGVTVLLVEQPWRVAGRRVADRPDRLDAAWVAALADPGAGSHGRLVVGGRSAGARVACRTAARLGAVAVLALAFPLHPPGRPDRSRAPELAVERPLLVVQGDRDPFGRPGEFPDAVAVAAVAGADHGFGVAKAGPSTASEAVDTVLTATVRWLHRAGEWPDVAAG